MRLSSSAARWWRSADATKQLVQRPRKHRQPPTPCRICHSDEESLDDPLVAPCRCDGTVRCVHNSCQQVWLRARRTPLDFSCELCHTALACRFTPAVRLEATASCATSAIVWAAEAASLARSLRLASRLLSASWRPGPGRVAGGLLRGVLRRGAAALLPREPPAAAAAAGDDAARSAGLQLATVCLSLLLASGCLGCLRGRRALRLLGEDVLSKVCVVKIGGCMLLALREVLWALPAAASFPPLARAWRVIGATLLLDTVVLALLRVPREERCSRGAPRRVVQTACRLSGEFLPFALLVFVWTAAVVVIVAAALVPCTALLLREASRNAHRGRLRHGSLQLALLVARLACLGAAAASAAAAAGANGTATGGGWGALEAAWSRCSVFIVGAWLGFEALLWLELRVLQRTVCCAAEGPSQVMWLVAVSGQVALAAWGRAGDPGAAAGVSCPGRSGATALGGGHWYLGRLPHSLGGCLGGATRAAAAATSRFTARVAWHEDFALTVMLICYVSMHWPGLIRGLRRLRQVLVTALVSIDPDQVVFYDAPPGREAPRGR